MRGYERVQYHVVLVIQVSRYKYLAVLKQGEDSLGITPFMYFVDTCHLVSQSHTSEKAAS